MRVICPGCQRHLVQDHVAYIGGVEDWKLIFWECLICGHKGSISYEEWDKWDTEDKEEWG